MIKFEKNSKITIIIIIVTLLECSNYKKIKLYGNNCT